MTPKIRAALEALGACVTENPEGLARAVMTLWGDELVRASLEKFGDVLLDRCYGIAKRGGEVMAYADITAKAMKIAAGYRTMDEPDLAEAFERFARRISDAGKKKLEVVVEERRVEMARLADIVSKEDKTTPSREAN